jgi:carboxyl-terminal processing protease
MKRFFRILMISIGLSIFTSVIFGAGVIFGGSGYLFEPDIARAQEGPAEFAIFWQVWDLTQQHFVDRSVLDLKRLTYGAINGMLHALGDEGHTRFLTPEEVVRQRSEISGSFSGIGAQVGMKDDMPVIIAPFDGSPAQQAGLKSGDIIIEVNGEDISGLPLNETVERLRGEKGTSVVLMIFRPETGESLEFSIVRDEIKVPAASWNMIPGTTVALLRLSQFSANLDDNVTEAIEEARAEGATQLIVDVRNNPGGLLEQAVKVTSEFLKEGDVLLQEDADGDRKAFPVRKGGVATDLPLVILVNEGSASSAEIFAGAIQDYQRGQVVGTTTFGTGTVLKPFDLEDGSALLLGTSQWLTPKGRLIRKQGIQPDVTVEFPVGATMILPTDLEDMTVTELLNSDDAQFMKALELLDALPQVALGEGGKYWQELSVIK